MRKVERSEILGLGEYEAIRPHFRQRIMEEKRHRRIAIGDHMTLIFENHDTMLLQVQEMLRTERITNEKAIRHELDTYNDVVPGAGELSATLMIEYVDPTLRREMATKLATLRRHVHLVIGNSAHTAEFRDLDGEEPDRLPSVNYLRFHVGHVAGALRAGPTLIRFDHPDYRAEAPLPQGVREAL
ncbi:MAG: DUF3501 family protein, partial [Myxococcales bacterium]|nr:DUF3501 family protein [Myxococcales bacterium]